MSNILHILNGDATFTGFSQTGLEGDVMIWREVLSEGPLDGDITSGEFWEQRRNFISDAYKVDADSYNGTLAELEKLSKPYTEYNLWFEFDLHCQVNLLGAMQLLQQHVDMSEPAVFLICPGEYPGKPEFKGMGELNGTELEYLYDNIRVQLTGYDFTLAAEAWQAYITYDADKLEQFISNTTFWANMPLLKPALEAHVKRLQLNSNGLNYIEQKLLDGYNSGRHTRPMLYIYFWQDESIYGMGDSQLNHYLDNLAKKTGISI